MFQKTKLILSFGGILALILFTQCKKDALSIANSSVIDHIDYTNDYRDWTETYFYDSNNRLDSVTKSNIHNTLRFLYDATGKLQKRITYSPLIQKVAFIDTFEYDNQQRLVKMSNFSINRGENLPLSMVKIFKYGNNNQIETEITLFPKDTFRITEYVWSGGNIVKMKEFDNNKKLNFEATLQYDDRKNPFKDLPTNIDNVLYLTNNNIVNNLGKDFTGLWDPVVNPTKTKYKYNNLDFPYEFQLNYEYKATIFYR
jgi:hypothetical protein